MTKVAEWKFDRGGWLQVYQLPERAGGGLEVLDDLKLVLCPRSLAPTLVNLPSMSLVPFTPFRR